MTKTESTATPTGDDDLRALWREAGGSIHDLRVTTATIPERKLLELLRKLVDGGVVTLVKADPIAAPATAAAPAEAPGDAQRMKAERDKLLNDIDQVEQALEGLVLKLDPAMDTSNLLIAAAQAVNALGNAQPAGRFLQEEVEGGLKRISQVAPEYENDPDVFTLYRHPLVAGEAAAAPAPAPSAKTTGKPGRKPGTTKGGAS